MTHRERVQTAWDKSGVAVYAKASEVAGQAQEQVKP